MNGEDHFLTIDEAAHEVLKSTKRFVYKQVENGNLNLFKVGAKSYVKQSEVMGLFKPAGKSKPD
jgi:excisionase family DNA binding protein